MWMLLLRFKEEKNRKKERKEKMNSMQKVVESIRPSPGELLSLKKTEAELKAHLKKATKREAVIVGSVAKGTFLSGQGDMDLFVLFEERLSKEKMKSELEGIFRKAFPNVKYQMNYAEHPYIRFHFNGIRIDLVPAYKMKNADERLTAVDRSVLHTKYILKNLSKKQKDEVRLLKKLLRANELYGAEIRVEGLSGYLCELLVIKYGSFKGVLRAASKWKQPIIIDLKNYYKKQEYTELIKRFPAAMIVIDPTDKNRNVAAAFSEENLKKFTALAKRFIKKPSQEHFFREETFDGKVKQLKKKNTVALIRFERQEIVDDILWGQLKKFMRALEYSLADFKPAAVFADADDEEVRIAVAVKKKIAGGLVERHGPPIEMKKHVVAFMKAHKGQKIIKRAGKLVVFVKTPDKKLENEIAAFIQENKERFSHLPLRKSK